MTAHDSPRAFTVDSTNHLGRNTRMDTLLRPQPGEPITDKIRRALFWLLILAALGAIAAGVTAWQGRSDVPDVTGHAASSAAAVTEVLAG